MNVKKTFCCFYAVVLLTCFFGFYFTFVPAQAEDGELIEGQSNIVNGGFEDPDLMTTNTDLNWKNADMDTVSGWKTTATDKLVEFGWMKNGVSPHMTPTITSEIIGEGASNGVQFAETVGNEPSSLYQSLAVSEGGSYNWTIHHRGREGVDTLAFIITDDSGIDCVKTEKTSVDHFQQIIAWMKENGVTEPEAGAMVDYTVYTTQLLSSNSFEEASSGSYFSFTPDEERTVKFEIWLMSTDKPSWGEYTGTYLSDAEKNILFVISSFKSNRPPSSTTSATTSGNLIDNLIFSDSEGNNLLTNQGFDDVAITSAYRLVYSANAEKPTEGIGWCTTASDYYVEIGNLDKGNAYNLDVELITTVLNAPWIREGNQFVELNADQESSLYQVVNTDPGKMYRWSLSHRGREGLDTMALIIGPSQAYAPKKMNSNSRDQLMQILDWIYSQTEMALDIPLTGCSNEITLYSPKFNSSGKWALGSNIFSWNKDSEHTEKWSVWIISSINDTWHDYGEIDSEAVYNYEYIVPEGQEQTIFGFVSHTSTRANGTKSATFGNLLDNISFKEYYYLDIDNPVNSAGGDLYITDEDDAFIFETPNAGWALADSNITVHLKEGSRDFIGAYINDVFVPKFDWGYDEEKGEYFYKFENIKSTVKIKIIYVAKTVVYDSKNDYEYQYDEIDGGYELPMSPSFDTYISHKPYADDGWEFVGWEYRSTIGNHVYVLDAVHKIVFEENAEDISLSTFSIYRILEGGETELVVSGIPYDEGVTFVAKWKYRQRVIAKTFDKTSLDYDIGTEGGYTDINVMIGEEAQKTDYVYNEEVVGKELYSSSDNVYMNVTAYSKIGFTFNGWYDNLGNSVSKSASYTYKVEDSEVVELFAYFEPVGYNVSINCTVDGDSAKYFAIECSFSDLRENKAYIISGLSTGSITINGEKVENPTVIRADDQGKATVTIYMKHSDSAVFIDLPENCIYSVQSVDEANVGYNVRGEVSLLVLAEATTIDLFYYNVTQSVAIAEGRHYTGISNEASSDEITITKNSSFTFEVKTQYTPGIYTGLYASLCLYNPSGSVKAFVAGTKILMVDLTDASNPRYYKYIVPESEQPITSIRLDQSFVALGSAEFFEQNVGSGSSKIIEKLAFIVDYADTGDLATNGKISLAYNDDDEDFGKAVAFTKNVVNIGADTTELTVTKANGGSISNKGPFVMNITVKDSYPAVNTKYTDGKYSIKLSLNNGMALPVGSYAEIGGIKYYSAKGYIIIPSQTAGNSTVKLCVPSPIEILDGAVKFKATLLQNVSEVELGSDEKSAIVTFECFDHRSCAIDAKIKNKVVATGMVSELQIALKHKGIDAVVLSVSRKNADGSLQELIVNVTVNLPSDENYFTVSLGNGFTVESGETYVVSFEGLVDNVLICSDVCYVVGGYL